MDKSVVLNYIDKAHQNLYIIGKKINRTIGLIVPVCLIIIAICFDVIKLSDSISFIGLTFKLSDSLLLVLLCSICYILQVFLYGYGIKETENSDLIIKLYKDIGFEHDSLVNENACVLEHPNPLSISFSPRMEGEYKFVARCNEAAFVGYTLLLLLLPLTAQITVWNKVFNEELLLHWKFIFISVICFLSVVNVINGIIKMCTKVKNSHMSIR